MDNILCHITQGDWVSYTNSGVGAKEPNQGLVHIASIAPRRRPGSNEGEANQKLIVLAPSHALILCAIRLGRASFQYPDTLVVFTKPSGPPVVGTWREDKPLTPDLRAALRAALGVINAG